MVGRSDGQLLTGETAEGPVAAQRQRHPKSKLSRCPIAVGIRTILGQAVGPIIAVEAYFA